MYNIISYLDSLPLTKYALFVITSASLLLKSIIACLLIIKRRPLAGSTKRAWQLMILFIISSIMIDIAWLISLGRTLFLPDMDFRILLIFIRISWGFMAILYQSIFLFIEVLIEESFRPNIRQYFYSCISFGFFLFACILTIFNFNCFSPEQRPAFELAVRNIESFYLIFILMLPNALFILWKLKHRTIPRILKKQLTLFLKIVVFPIVICDIVQLYPLAFSLFWTTNSYLAACVSTILLNLAAYHCARRLTAMRFLNIHNHVQSFTQFPFVDRFKNTLERLSNATNPQELEHITKRFFKDTFSIPTSKTHFYAQKSYFEDDPQQKQDTISSFVEGFLSTISPATNLNVKKAKVLIYDEVAFNYFYEKSTINQTLMHFLDTVNADIFLPIYHETVMIAYIVIERYDREDRLYHDIDRDEMFVYATYLANVMNLMQNRSLQTLLYQEKDLKDQLYLKHQEVNQYKESIRSFLHTKTQKKIGIMFHKNRTFIYGNKDAKDFIPFNVNTEVGHHLAKTLKKLVKQVEEYNEPQQLFTQDTEGERIVVAGVPHIKRHETIITIYYPEVSDIITKKLAFLQNPTEWDYILYLETTKAGKLINKLIPQCGKELLNFKINLLKCAMSKKALLLKMPDEDLISTVEILHHISLREHLEIVSLKQYSRDYETAIKLFGINTLFRNDSKTEPLLKKLNGKGTLFIKNIHFLEHETQEYLAEFIRYGIYKIFKSEQKIASNVRVICSTDQDLSELVSKGLFSQLLFNELKQTSLALPPLSTLSPEEIHILAEGFTEQAIESTDLKNFLALTEKEKTKLTHSQPVSLKEIREKIHVMLKYKSKANNLPQGAILDPNNQLMAPELMKASRLGKRALKDPQIMQLLWNKFKSQTKISTFLGVNRSSVNRRCKEYNLE
jgi:transcriptional regulator of aromatic amino acid metabolism